MNTNKHALSFLGVVSPGAAAFANPHPADPHLGASLVPGVAAGVVGFMKFPKHPVLGFLGGEALGMNAYRFYRNLEGDRTRALCNLGTTGLVIAGSLRWKEHPFWGGVLGLAMGALITGFIEGSNSHKFVMGLRSERT